MPVDVSNFIGDVNNFGGLYKVADDLREENIRREHLAQAEKARKATTGKMLTDYLDPKDFLTGTNYDPLVTSKLGQIMQEGMNLVNTEGVDSNMLMMALAPKVNKLSQESQTIKAIDKQRSEALSLLKDQKAIDQRKFNEEFKNHVYYDTDEKGNKVLKDITSLDPNQDFADEVLRTKNVYTPEGFNEFVAKAGKNTYGKDVRMIGPKGGMEAKKISITAPSFMQPEMNEKGVFTGEFVPEYEYAYDNGKPITGTFQKNGTLVEAPIRLLKKDIWDNGLPPAAKAYALQESRNWAKQEGIPISDPRVENHARAVAYDHIKESGKQFSGYQETVAEKAAPAPKINLNVNTGQETPVRQLYKNISDVASDVDYNKHTGAAFQDLDADAQVMILDKLNKIRGNDEKWDASKVYIRKEPDGIWVMDASKPPSKIGDKIPSDAYLMKLDRVGVDVPVQPNAKAKQAVIAGGGDGKTIQPKSQSNTKNFKGVPKGGF